MQSSSSDCRIRYPGRPVVLGKSATLLLSPQNGQRAFTTQAEHVRQTRVRLTWQCRPASIDWVAGDVDIIGNAPRLAEDVIRPR